MPRRHHSCERSSRENLYIISTSTPPIVLNSSSQPAASLNPKEHGAYAILSVPIATAFLIAGPTMPGLCIALAALAGFFANEPLLVAWGHRGSRAQRTTPSAMRRLAILTAITVACGSLAWWLSGCRNDRDRRLDDRIRLVMTTEGCTIRRCNRRRFALAQHPVTQSTSAECDSRRSLRIEPVVLPRRAPFATPFSFGRSKGKNAVPATSGWRVHIAF